MIKTQEQINDIKEAIKITEKIIQEVRDFIKVGMTEKEVLDFILGKVEKSDASDVSFPPIIATGSNAAAPHHEPSDTIIEEGDLIVLDMGVFYNGMASDITRMIAMGDIDEEQQEVYDIVREALDEATKLVIAGAKASSIDMVARDVIQWGGYLENFIHTTGHGLGKEVHEKPMIFFKSKDILKTGMIITIEPGIYLEDNLGVRLENDLLVTDDGYELLTTSSLDY